MYRLTNSSQKENIIHIPHSHSKCGLYSISDRHIYIKIIIFYSFIQNVPGSTLLTADESTLSSLTEQESFHQINNFVYVLVSHNFTPLWPVTIGKPWKLEKWKEMDWSGTLNNHFSLLHTVNKSYDIWGRKHTSRHGALASLCLTSNSTEELSRDGSMSHPHDLHRPICSDKLMALREHLLLYEVPPMS